MAGCAGYPEDGDFRLDVDMLGCRARSVGWSLHILSAACTCSFCSIVRQAAVEESRLRQCVERENPLGFCIL